MEVRSFLGKIGDGNESVSLPEEIFRSYQKKEISKLQYETLTAAWVAENSFKYLPRAISPLSQRSRAYAQGRLSGITEYNYTEAKILGEWFYLVMQSLSENATDFELLLWCKTRCEGSKLIAEAEKISNLMKRYTREITPVQDIEETIRVKKKDANARDRK